MRKMGGRLNGAPTAPECIPFDKMQTKLLDTLKSADSDLARRVKEREVLSPILCGLIRTFSTLAEAGQISDLELEYLEPGTYGDDEVYFPQRIRFTWNVVGYDKLYSNSEDFSITLMGDSSTSLG